MIYNNYYNGGYIPQTQQNQQTIQSQVLPQNLQYLPISDLRFLNESQINGFVVYPNTKVLLIDREKGKAYIESADNMGNLYKQVYKFELISPENTQSGENQSVSSVATNNDILKAISELKTMLETKPNTNNTNANTNNKRPKEVTTNE